VRQPLFRAVDGAMIRVTAGDPADAVAAAWPEGAASDEPAAWHAFIGKAWAAGNISAAVELASPSLAATVREVLSGGAVGQKAVRAGMALARYLVRLRGRPTPFGLFAGVAPARVGGPAAGAWGPEHRLAARADGRWLAALVTELEAWGPLRARLRVTASDLLTVRGDRIVVSWLPPASALAQDAPAEISLRRSPAAETALRMARAPVTVSELARKLAAAFGPADTVQASAMIRELMACGALISDLRPPSTTTDGLAWVLDRLGADGAGDLPATAPMAALQDTQSRLRRAAPADLDGIAARMSELADATAPPVAVDLRADCQVIIPQPVADEAAVAASALARLSPHPHGTSGWREYHGQFLDRYGTGTAVPVRDLLDPVSGLGLPSHYAAPPPRIWCPRDERLAALAQQAVLDGATEVVLDDALLTEIAGPEGAGAQPAPHMDITVAVRAASAQAATEGTFTITVCGAGRTAMATSGRFLHLLTASERTRLAQFYRDLPTAAGGAVAAQLSFPPHHPRAENVARVPRMLPHLLSVGEHHGQDAPGQIPLDDLAVTAGPGRLYLMSLSRRVPVEPVLACAPAWHAAPPVVRLLFELPRAHCAPVAVFDWGALASMPFLPRLRLGRAILAPARWRIRTGALPGAQTGQDEWTAALGRLQDKLRLPGWVTTGSGDRQLRLCLDHPMDLALLRAHLDASGGTAVLTESWAPDDHAWCGGRAHEIVIPLAATTPAAPPPKALTRPGPLPPAGRDHGNLPGAGGVLSARLYSDPALFDLIVTDYLPALTGGWDNLALWWFIRYRGRERRHHLRLRLHAADCGQAAARTGQWAASLRRQGLADDLVLDTYRPETGRFGAGPALAAAETLFAADSAAATAQLSTIGTYSPLALTAASLADLSAALLGGRHAGMQWLTARPQPPGPEPLDRDARRQALALTGAGPGDTVPAPVRRAWSARADAAGQYAARLAETSRDPAGVLESLLHLHHNRVHGPGPDAEAVTYRLARACALRHTTLSGTAGQTGAP
jgi:thiopeptide-type bacteriocin biosynthesis protein